MPRSHISRVLSALILSWYALALIASGEVDDPIAKLEVLIRSKKWNEATKSLATLEKEGRCAGATCLVAHALIAVGQEKAEEAATYARQAAEGLGKEPALSAWLSNELGAVLYRRADGRKEILQLAETALRHAQSVYRGRASNIRVNLATALTALGHRDEAKRIVDALESEGGVVVDPKMAILGDFSGPEKE